MRMTIVVPLHTRCEQAASGDPTAELQLHCLAAHIALVQQHRLGPVSGDGLSQWRDVKLSA